MYSSKNPKILINYSVVLISLIPRADRQTDNGLIA